MKFTTLTVQALVLLAVGSGVSTWRGATGKGLVFAAAEDAEEDPRVPTLPEDGEPANVEEEEAEEKVSYLPPQDATSYQFEADVHRMLDIVVNSLYQHKEVFLRELISNASDALDKFRYLSLTHPDKYKSPGDDDIPLEVRIQYDEDEKTVTIRDTGVGMTREEMVQNLGTVARSGTTKFIDALKDGGNPDAAMSQIGQFGVGFYSTFLVADRVVVASKSPADPVQHVWESANGSSDFHVYEDPRGNSLARGTEITLHLKDDSHEYADADRLRDLAHHYSEFVVHPISLRETTLVDVEEDEDEEGDGEPKEPDEKDSADDEEKDDIEVSDDDDEDDETPKKKTKQVTTHSWEQLNTNPAIWTRDKEEITEDEYQSFFHVLAGDDEHNSTQWVHFNAEGNINFKSILYLPDDIPMSYKMGNMEAPPGTVRLYVRKVLIGDDFDLLPRYLGFIKGVVDSDDLTLNVNRETLQENKVMQVIRKKLVRKAIDLIKQLAKESEDEEKEKEDEEGEDGSEAEIDADGNVVVDDKKKKDKKHGEDSRFIQWYKKFSPNIKLGVMDDAQNKGRLTKLLRFETSKSKGKLISLQQYVDNMKEWQDDLYVLGGTSGEELMKSAFLEPFNEKDLEVIFMTDPIDEYMVRNIRDYDGHKFSQVSSENVKFKDEDEGLVKRREKAYKEKFQPLVKWLRKLYKGTVLRVQVAKRSLGSVPAVVTSSDFGNSANMERILKAQALQHGVDAKSIKAMRIFELNPRHPLVLKLLEGCPAEDEDGEGSKEVSDDVLDAAWIIHDMAMLNGGFSITDPDAHNKRMLKVLQSQFGLGSLALEDEIDPPEEEEDDDELPEPDLNMFDGGMNMDDFADMDEFGDMNLDDLDLDSITM